MEFLTIFLWPFMFAFNTVFVVIGLIVIPIAVLFGSYHPVMDTDGAGRPRVEYHFNSKLMWIWDNDEDGIANDTYWKAPNLPLQIIYWSAIRNPANNLRFVPYVSVRINPNNVQYIGSFGSGPEVATKYDDYNSGTHKKPQWFFAWDGPYSNFFWQFKLFDDVWRFWVGWKIMPRDIYGVEDYRARGAGFAVQLKDID